MSLHCQAREDQPIVPLVLRIAHSEHSAQIIAAGRPGKGEGPGKTTARPGKKGIPKGKKPQVSFPLGLQRLTRMAGRLEPIARQFNFGDVGLSARNFHFARRPGDLE